MERWRELWGANERAFGRKRKKFVARICRPAFFVLRRPDTTSLSDALAIRAPIWYASTRTPTSSALYQPAVCYTSRVFAATVILWDNKCRPEAPI